MFKPVDPVVQHRTAIPKTIILIKRCSIITLQMVTVTMTHAHIASTAGLVSIYLQCLQHKNTNHTLMPQWLFSFCFSSRPHHSILVIIMVHYQTGPRITSPLFWSLETARMHWLLSNHLKVCLHTSQVEPQILCLFQTTYFLVKIQHCEKISSLS